MKACYYPWKPSRHRVGSITITIATLLFLLATTTFTNPTPLLPHCEAAFTLPKQNPTTNPYSTTTRRRTAALVSNIQVRRNQVPKPHLSTNLLLHHHHPDEEASSTTSPNNNNKDKSLTRRSILRTLPFLLPTTTLLLPPNPSHATIGTLTEFSTTPSILQGLTLTVADQSQLESTISFFLNGFSASVLRERSTVGSSLKEVWIGFGPETLDVPEDWITGVSGWDTAGGHGSIKVVCDNTSTDVFYRVGDGNLPGDNLAYLQLAVPSYRISQMASSGGVILDAYGIVNAISPAGLPVRGIVGIAPDPMMFVAINCIDVEASRLFYESLGFVEQEYPYARPNKGQGQFEPPQPPNSVYIAPSPNSMGILLLPSNGKKKPNRKPKPLKPNPVVQGLNIVFDPDAMNVKNGGDGDGGVAGVLVDPSSVKLSFVETGVFEKEERMTREAMAKSGGLAKS